MASDGKVAVSAAQAIHLTANCEYFRAMFEHGTIEDATRLIEKPDCRTVATASSIVSLESALV